MAIAMGKPQHGKAPGRIGSQTDQLKEWLEAAKWEENPDLTHWNVLVKLVQHAFETGETPEDIARLAMVLLPREVGNSVVSGCWNQHGK